MFTAFYGAGNTGFIDGFTLNPADGSLAQIGTGSLESDSFFSQRYLAVDPSGQFLIVAPASGSLLESFLISTGTLGPAPVSIQNGVQTPGAVAVTGTLQ
jgi:6-phosphogluconolactonase (cycloisomerase 2 family)